MHQMFKTQDHFMTSELKKSLNQFFDGPKTPLWFSSLIKSTNVGDKFLVSSEQIDWILFEARLFRESFIKVDLLDNYYFTLLKEFNPVEYYLIRCGVNTPSY